MGGMAVAARLSTQGHAVTVLEQAMTHGGKVGRLERDGFVFDTGPSLLTLPAVYRDLFLKTALSRKDAALEDNVGLVPVEPAFAYTFADGTGVELPNASRAGISDALDGALRSRRRRAVDGARRPRRTRLGRDPRALPDQPAAVPDRAAAAVAAAARPAHGRPVHLAARARPPVPARPAAAADAGPLRDLLRLGPAAGPGRAVRHPVRGADLRCVARRGRAARARGRVAQPLRATRSGVPVRRRRRRRSR